MQTHCPYSSPGPATGARELSGKRGLLFWLEPAEHKDMGHPQRIHTYDDELHERRRHLAIVREPIDFEAERLKRLVDRARDTRDP